MRPVLAEDRLPASLMCVGGAGRAWPSVLGPSQVRHPGRECRPGHEIVVHGDVPTVRRAPPSRVDIVSILTFNIAELIKRDRLMITILNHKMGSNKRKKKSARKQAPKIPTWFFDR